MSQDELVNAYVSGRISRRTFIRRLAIAGVSLAAAATYAEVLVPAANASPRSETDSGGHHPHDVHAGSSSSSSSPQHGDGDPDADDDTPPPSTPTDDDNGAAFTEEEKLLRFLHSFGL
jgi:hypothetical protein